ncbi:MAG TPA: SRPBCC family protein [Planctomycetota bacterium]|nr:SRPBCC family protein [Planctomycetota bacterium]
MSHPRIRIQATITATREQVWRCWTAPEHITRWNFASDDRRCPSARNELKVGGTYAARMEAKDGSFGFDFEAIYDEVVEPARLGYTMADGRRASTDFTERDGSTTVTTTFDAEAVNDLEMQRAGWQAILDNFKAYVESR